MKYVALTSKLTEENKKSDGPFNVDELEKLLVKL